jgi:hypothetical protein
VRLRPVGRAGAMPRVAGEEPRARNRCDQMATKDDLESVRECDWFRAMLG